MSHWCISSPLSNSLLSCVVRKDRQHIHWFLSLGYPEIVRFSESRKALEGHSAQAKGGNRILRWGSRLRNDPFVTAEFFRWSCLLMITYDYSISNKSVSYHPPMLLRSEQLIKLDSLKLLKAWCNFDWKPSHFRAIDSYSLSGATATAQAWSPQFPIFSSFQIEKHLILFHEYIMDIMWSASVRIPRDDQPSPLTMIFISVKHHYHPWFLTLTHYHHSPSIDH